MYRVRIPIGLLLLATIGAIFALEYSREITYPSRIVIALLIVGSLWEYYKLIERRGCRPYLHYGMIGAGIGLLLILVVAGNAFARIEKVQYYYGTALFMVLFLIGLWEPQEDKVLEKTSSTAAGLLYVYFSLGYLLSIRGLGNREGIICLLFVVLVAKSTDIGGYLVGRLWGKHKLYPAISPKKSWEGFAGGLVLSVVATFALRSAFPLMKEYFTIIWAIVFAVVMSILSLLGDFAESLVKRKCQAKDSNQLIPEFGGILDLMDSLIFTAPAGYFFLVCFQTLPQPA